jgi:predicted metal-dependent enzyme (double-stranded beta helix superfamily)
MSVAAPAVPAPARALAPHVLLSHACNLAGDAPSWHALARHDAAERWSLRLAVAADHDVWLIGWAPGQGVELHDHAGSSGAFVVVGGELVEQAAGRENVAPLGRRGLTAGMALAFGPGHIHRVANESTEPATSIHLYSPPLSAMDFYVPDDDRLQFAYRGVVP